MPAGKDRVGGGVLGLRIGVDIGGTKIEGLVLAPDGRAMVSRRVPTPRHDYEATIRAICNLVRDLEAQAGPGQSIGVGLPGSVSPRTGLMQNANSTWLNGRPFKADLAAALGRPVRMANDANCFVLSEAQDGAGAGAYSVFGVILGTGCGGGLVVEGRLLDGPRGIGGEWGHNPLPWPRGDELAPPSCWCGRPGCIEVWVSGPGLAADHERTSGAALSAEEIVARAAGGDAAARASLARHADRLARGLSHIVNLFDPEVIVLGGGLSQLAHLYEVLPGLMARWVFADDTRVAIRQPRWGDASGVRGAARLWPLDADDRVSKPE
jgi:fructokinase